MLYHIVGMHAVIQSTVPLVWHSSGISSISCVCACNIISNSRYKPGQCCSVFSDEMQFWNSASVLLLTGYEDMCKFELAVSRICSNIFEFK